MLRRTRNEERAMCRCLTPILPTTPDDDLADMTFVAGGTFSMGSDAHYPEERPVHRAVVDGFWIDRTPVTNAMFGAFVNSTGYVTVAEVAPKASDYPGALKKLLTPGSLVFSRPAGPVDLGDFHNWWRWTPGADWRHPRGPNSSIRGRDDHPVVHIAYADVDA